jgi:RNA polymerase sigma factor (sigma-70 family)
MTASQNLTISIERIERVATTQVRLIASSQCISDVRDDLTQEARIKAWKLSLSWHPGGTASYETYASRPVRLRLLEFLRDRRQKLSPETRDLSDGCDESRRIEEHITARGVRKVVLGEIRHLDPLEAELIYAKYYKDQDLKAWAAQRGRSKAWASELHCKVLSKLKRQRTLCAI